MNLGIIGLFELRVNRKDKTSSQKSAVKIQENHRAWKPKDRKNGKPVRID
jgi:hypothetical protein